MLSELEKQLLSCLGTLQAGHESQHKGLLCELETVRESFTAAQSSLRQMFDTTSQQTQQNRALHEQAQGLQAQVQDLQAQVLGLQAQVSSLTGAIERLIGSSNSNS